MRCNKCVVMTKNELSVIVFCVEVGLGVMKYCTGKHRESAGPLKAFNVVHLIS